MGMIETPPQAADGTVGKALVVLDMVADMNRPVRFNDVLAHSPYPKATLYRLLQTLTNQGLLAYDVERQTYAPGMRLVRLAHMAWRQSSLAPIGRPFVEALAARTGETVHLAQIESGQVLFVDKLRASDRFETLAQVGSVAPAYCTGVGKAMLAFMAPARLDMALKQQSYFQFTKATHGTQDALQDDLEGIRTARIAYDNEEHEEGIISIAAPILSGQGRIIGAISIATTTSRHSLTSLGAYKTNLLETADKIGAEATPWQFPG